MLMDTSTPGESLEDSEVNIMKAKMLRALTENHGGEGSEDPRGTLIVHNDTRHNDTRLPNPNTLRVEQPKRPPAVDGFWCGDHLFPDPA